MSGIGRADLRNWLTLGLTFALFIAEFVGFCLISDTPPGMFVTIFLLLVSINLGGLLTGRNLIREFIAAR